MMNTLINPIYPNEEERIYNAHIKARALAGCYRDKKWYVLLAVETQVKELKQKN